MYFFIIESTNHILNVASMTERLHYNLFSLILFLNPSYFLPPQSNSAVGSLLEERKSKVKSTLESGVS